MAGPDIIKVINEKHISQFRTASNRSELAGLCFLTAAIIRMAQRDQPELPQFWGGVGGWGRAVGRVQDAWAETKVCLCVCSYTCKGMCAHTVYSYLRAQQLTGLLSCANARILY